MTTDTVFRDATTSSATRIVEHEIGPSGELVLKVVEGDIAIRAVDGGTARVTIHAPGLEDRIGIDRLPGALHVRLPERFLSLGWLGVDLGGILGQRRAVRLDVELPRAARLSVDGASSRVIGDGLAGEQRFHLVSGDLRLIAGGGRISFDGVSGRVLVDAALDTALAARTVSGDVELNAPRIRGLRMSSMSGSLRVAGEFVGSGPFEVETVSGPTILATDGPIRIDARTISGDVSSDRAATGDSLSGRRILDVGAGGPTFTFRSMSGGVRVTSRPSGWRPAEPPPPAPGGPAAEAAPAPGPDAPAVPAPTGTPSAGAGVVAPVAADAGEPAVPGGHTFGATAGGVRGSDPRLWILRALERGEISVEEAARRLGEIDATSHG